MESSLADAYKDLIGSVGHRAGWGRGSDLGDEAWDDIKLGTLKETVKRGLRQFYKPPPVDDSGVSHNWSFLAPYVTVTLASGESTVLLPFDFGGVVGGRVDVSTTQVNTPPCLYVTGGVRAFFALYPDQTGSPRKIEIEPIKGTSSAHGQRSQFLVFPTADADYTLGFNYAIHGEMLSGNRPYAYGAAEHAETILASCLAVWERNEDDIDDGPAYKHWMRCLAASISIDRGKRPATWGFNKDSSDRVEMGYGRARDRGVVGTYPPLTYNGILYD